MAAQDNIEQTPQVLKHVQENSRLSNELQIVLAESEAQKNHLLNEIRRLKEELATLEINLNVSEKDRNQKKM